jgi:hypothetical protein
VNRSSLRITDLAEATRSLRGRLALALEAFREYRVASEPTEPAAGRDRLRLKKRTKITKRPQRRFRGTGWLTFENVSKRMTRPW